MPYNSINNIFQKPKGVAYAESPVNRECGLYIFCIIWFLQKVWGGTQIGCEDISIWKLTMETCTSTLHGNLT